jgi:predicted kinase
VAVVPHTGIGCGEPNVTSGATVHLLAGLNGAGKTTYARRLERELPAVRFTLDEWMLRLYRLPFDHPEYPAKAETTKALIWDTAEQVLATGTDVVLDWNQWSAVRRAFWRDKAVEHGHRPVLHYLEVSVPTAIERAEQRLLDGSQVAHALDAEAIRHLHRLFEVPLPDEGMEVRVVGEGSR